MRWPKAGLLVGIALLAGGAVVLAQEAPFANGPQGKPSANTSGAQTTRFPTESESPRLGAAIANLPLTQGKEEATKSPTAECVEPPPMVRWQDYDGPLKKTVGAFAGRLERKSAHPPHYKPGAVLCSFAPKDKFILFVQDTIDPVTFLGVGFDAGIDQAQNSDPTFGQGAAGYGKRFGANFADEASSTFFKDFAFPSLFSEDPRYYRLVHASGGRGLVPSGWPLFLVVPRHAPREV